RWGFVAAVLISYSRIYLGLHYPSDILAGAVYGIIMATLALFLQRVIEGRRGRKPS
ncbi:unnamed protein product, partial [marine sediment metagenome]